MIMVSPTGARLTRADHPALPMTIPDIVETTRACAANGADALHLHVRDREGRHSLDTGLYKEALAALDAELPGFPVQITTEAAGRYTPEAQCALLENLAPRWASISLREILPEPALARRVYDLCRHNGTEIQHIVFDTDDIETLRMWQAKGVLSDQESVILVLGRYGDRHPARPSDLDPLLDRLPPVKRWMVCAFGPAEHACLRYAFGLGGDVRVGFENSTTDEDGTPWPDVQSSVRSLCTELRQSA